MAPYQKMYAILCGAAAEAVDRIERDRSPEAAAKLLRAALLEAEGLYVSAEEDCLCRLGKFCRPL